VSTFRAHGREEIHKICMKNGLIGQKVTLQDWHVSKIANLHAPQKRRAMGTNDTNVNSGRRNSIRVDKTRDGSKSINRKSYLRVVFDEKEPPY
jgi:hypothetical protein